jgi:hypothetical protein
VIIESVGKERAVIPGADQTRGIDSRRNAQRSLGAAQGVLVATRKYSLDDAFAEIIQTAKRHNVAPIELAEALVSIAEGRRNGGVVTEAMAAATEAWAALLERHIEGAARRKYLYTQMVEPIPGADEADLLEQQLAVSEDDDLSRNR